MKKITYIVLSGALLATYACKGKTETPVENEVEVVNYEVYGDSTMTIFNAISGQELLAQLEAGDSISTKVEATIAEVCQKKGCWMDITLAENKNVTVRFQDYSFFVPMDAGGKNAVIEGIAQRKIETVEWLKHKAEDAGKSAEEIAAINTPDTTYSIMATGVIIKQ